MDIQSHGKFLRLSPRKARLVVNYVRGKKALDAIALLNLMPQKAAHEVSKVINSALANAQHNYGIAKTDFLIKEISANIGPTFKRFSPRARGSADVIKRKTTHLSVILTAPEGSKVNKKTIQSEVKKDKDEKISKENTAIQSDSKPAEVNKSSDAIKAKKEILPKESAVNTKQPSKTVNKSVKTKQARSKPDISNIKHLEKKQKEQVRETKESFLGGIKRIFRRKEF